MSLREKRIQFDSEVLDALELLASDRMMGFQELADEAFRDLFKKHDKPIDSVQAEAVAALQR